MRDFPFSSFVLAALLALAGPPSTHAQLPARSDLGAVQATAVASTPAWVPTADASVSIAIDACSVSAEVGAERVIVRSTGAYSPGEATLRVTQFGRLGAAVAVASGRVTLDGVDARVARSGFDEWYRPCEQGLEQGFTITAPPEDDGAGRPLWIGLAFEGLLPQIFDDGSGARLVDEHARERLLYHSLHAFDADGRALAARMMVGESGVGLRVDDRGARYPITIDPVLGPPIWSFTVPMVNAGTDPVTGAAALRACTAGDVNGDGYSDILVFTWRFGVTSANEEIGRAWVFHGAAGLPSALPSWTSDGPSQASARFGYDATPLGDVNGDCYDDVAISAQLYDNGQTDEGAVFVYLGSATGLGASAAWVLEGDATNAMATLAQLPGDVDGDGYHDVLLLTRIATAPVSLYRGGPTPPVAPAWTMLSTLHAFTAIAGSGVGDVNGDGRDDFLLGESDPAPTSNSVDLYFGDGTGVSGAAWSASIPSSARFGFVGQRTIGTGDFNQDGRPDLAISALMNGSVPSSVNIYLGTGGGLWFPSTPSHVLSGPPLFDYAHGLMSAGDFDGDGYPDLAIGSPLPGSVAIHAGIPFGINPSATSTLTLAPPQSGANFGTACGTAGDVNGDGLSDVFVVAATASAGNGLVQVFRSFPGLPLVPPPPGQTSTLTGTATSRFGTSLAFTGDVDGDGFNDLLVGAPNHDTAALDAGRAELFRGTRDGVSATASWTWTGTTDFQRTGAAVAFAGDVNGDGRTDAVIGVPGYSNGQLNEGRVLVFLATGSPGTPLELGPVFTFESNVANARLGESVAAAGDLNGDGFADLVAGAPGTAEGQSERGALYVFLGHGLGQGGYPLALNRYVLGPAASAQFGHSVAGVGDVNRDGLSDVLIGAPGVSNGESGEGRAYLYLGNFALGLDPTAAWTDEANSASASFGFAVTAAGDVDADGYADFLVGAPGFQAASSGGRAYLYRGRSASPPVVPSPQTLDGGQANARFGASVAFAGDVNSDGFSDVAFGAPIYNSGAGRLTVHIGTSSGLNTAPDDAYVGAAGAQLGAGLGPCGDLDGDGFSELCAGEPAFNNGDGQLLIYVGGTQGGATTVVQQRRINSVAVIDRLGLTDSTSSFLMSGGTGGPNNATSNPTGQGAMALEYELESAGSLFDGQGLQRGAFQPGSGLSITATASGLLTNERYQWRARLVTRNPLFPHTRWLLMQGAGRHEKRLGTGVDCNGNNVADQTEIAGGASDCNTNLLLDSCEIAAGAPDCNANGRVDSCDLPGNDANGSTIPDDCEFQPYCFGDGTGTPCPCGNSGVQGRGCANSVIALGAWLTWSGNPDVSSDTVTLLGGGMPNSTALYLQGTLQDGGGLGIQLFDGLRCITGSIVRLATKTNASNQSQYPDVGNPSVSVRGGVPASGGTRHYQVYYRNATAAFCPPATANWSNGLSVIWRP